MNTMLMRRLEMYERVAEIVAGRDPYWTPAGETIEKSDFLEGMKEAYWDISSLMKALDRHAPRP